jgi:hypothetical protein
MINLLLQHKDIKFINNLALSKMDFCNKLVANTKNILYQLYYTYNFTHIIFISSLIEKEEKQFISEFSNNISIFIYNDNHDQFLTTKYPNISGVLENSSVKIKQDKIINIPNLVNNEIFFENKLNKNNDIICFLDSIEKIPINLDNYLYPKSNLPIKLFNNPDIINPQNLGLLSEIDKAEILQKSLYYLAINEDYIPEAWACGCIVLTIDELKDLKPQKYKHSKKFQSYSNFLKGIIHDR